MQQKQHEAQQVKIQHMQEFVDKFRYNAKRASLVQSRIKTIEKETVVDAVEEEVSFSFSFFDSGQLGRPIIQIEGVTFGYDYSLAPSNTKPALFYDVHLNVDQSSRVALVGPNGCGKVRCMTAAAADEEDAAAADDNDDDDGDEDGLCMTEDDLYIRVVSLQCACV